MLRFFYEEIFDAEFIPERAYIADGAAAVEGRFVGKHVGEFAGVAGTDKEIDVPLAVFYTVEERGITEGRVWIMLSSILTPLEPLGCRRSSAAQVRRCFDSAAGAKMPTWAAILGLATWIPFPESTQTGGRTPQVRRRTLRSGTGLLRGSPFHRLRAPCPSIAR